MRSYTPITEIGLFTPLNLPRFSWGFLHILIPAKPNVNVLRFRFLPDSNEVYYEILQRSFTSGLAVSARDNGEWKLSALSSVLACSLGSGSRGLRRWRRFRESTHREEVGLRRPVRQQVSHEFREPEA